MSNEEMASRLQVLEEFRHEALLGRPVEIDHDIAAKNKIQRLLDREALVHEIHPAECDYVGQVRLHFHEPTLFSAPLEEMPRAILQALAQPVRI